MGARVQNIIEINGKKYNAATGEQIGDSSRSPQSLDGMTPMKTGKPTTVNAPTPAHARPRTTAKHATKTTQKSQTLMRRSVKKPTRKISASEQPAAVAGIRKRSLGGSQDRARVAQQVKKSEHISKFNDQQRSSVVKLSSNHQVKHLPSRQQVNKLAKQTQAHNNAQRTQQSKSARMIENSLANATAHEHEEIAPVQRSTRNKFMRKLGISARAAGLSSAVLAAVLLGGFFAVQNVPNLSMRVAAARAGFDARMPDYNPSGFSFKGPISYQSGQVKVSFRSNTDDRHYDVVQRSSNWNSESLLSNYILDEDKQYQTYVDRGRTLYIYDGSNATWVDDGVWYVVEGQSAMTTDQLVRLAASI